MSHEPLLRVENLCKYYPHKSKNVWEKSSFVRAVNDVSFTLQEGESLGIVGESGCGKSTLGQCILQLQKPTSGKVYFRNEELTGRSERQMKAVRKDLQMIFQDPYSSLDPRRTIRQTLMEPLDALHRYSTKEKDARIGELLEMVALNPDVLDCYPDAFSGGQRQRIGIARAFATHPELIICDEAVSALDVSVQAQIINLLMKLKKETKVSYLFISHDLSVVHHICDRIAVMYVGRIVEIADAKELFSNPLHPYTKMLMRAIPIPDPNRKMEFARRNDTEFPSPLQLPSGCAFHPRCEQCEADSDNKEDLCRGCVPELTEVSPGHFCACHMAGKDRA